MDTLKDMQTLEELYQGGEPPWALWRTAADQDLMVAGGTCVG